MSFLRLLREKVIQAEFRLAAAGGDPAGPHDRDGGAGQSQQQIEPDLFSLLLLGASSAARDLRGLLFVAGTCSAGPSRRRTVRRGRPGACSC
jgi:hypothetical protein